MKDRSYLMAFANEDGGVYNVHLTDDLESHGTWEYIDFKFSLPDSCYILIWRRDEKKLDNEEIKYVTKYVRDDMRDFINDGEPLDDKNNRWHYKITKKVVSSNTCLILQWDDLILPDQFSSWKEFAMISYDVALEESKQISKPGSLHDLELDIYEGRLQQELASGLSRVGMIHQGREKTYKGCNIPSDEVLREYFTEMLLEDYTNANLLLSKHYEIFSAKVDTENDPPEKSYVYYDFVNHTIMFSPARIPELYLQVPAFLLGFFRHLALVKDWRFDENLDDSVRKERLEAEKFAQNTIKRMLEIGIDPR